MMLVETSRPLFMSVQHPDSGMHFFSKIYICTDIYTMCWRGKKSLRLLVAYLLLLIYILFFQDNNSQIQLLHAGLHKICVGESIMWTDKQKCRHRWSHRQFNNHIILQGGHLIKFDHQKRNLMVLQDNPTIKTFSPQTSMCYETELMSVEETR